MSTGHHLLTVPGYTGSGPDHWQSRWERNHPAIRRVQQSDWDRPERESWVEALDRSIPGDGRPSILVAHSLGCAVVAHWAGRVDSARRVAGALLVAPADVQRPGLPPELRDFAPLPMHVLPFPSVVVASRDDPWISFRRARQLAVAWGSDLVDAGRRGHLNSESLLGEWPEGWAMVEELSASITVELEPG